jgi:hypothetical protein
MTATDWLKTLVSLRAIPWRLLAGLWVMLTLVLFGPRVLQARLHVVELVKTFGGYAGAAWLLLSVVLLMEGMARWLKWRKARASSREHAKRAIVALSSLDPSEISVLREFWIQARNTLELPIDHPVVAGLYHKGILTTVGGGVTGSMVGVLASMAIRESILPAITGDLLGIPAADQMTQADFDRIRRERPEFSEGIERHNQFFASSAESVGSFGLR